jgi:16S rRNA (cytidine1402-2'-O)-methyltransferase
LVSDAGTPAISDPGHVIVKACLENNIAVESLPGPTAFIPALINSGFPTDSFIFESFLPHKKGRKTKVESLIDEPRTVILYESPHRMHKLLEEFNSILGEDRNISVSREITKKFEETITGTVNELLNHFTNTDPRGEFVVVVEGIRKKKVKVNKYKQD